MNGKLYIVATPIGNLEDITLRAVRVLREVDLIAAENTRHALKLLSHYQVKTRIVVYSRDRNTHQAASILKRVEEGADAALITNAGTPGISDPGSYLVRSALARGFPVIPIPGPSAFAAAVSVSGMPSAGLVFLGYLSPRKGRRKKQLERFSSEDLTLVIYESPHRLAGTLEDIYRVMGARTVVVARELTKKFEEVLRADIRALIDVFRERKPRGEFTLLICGKGCEEKND